MFTTNFWSKNLLFYFLVIKIMPIRILSNKFFNLVSSVALEKPFRIDDVEKWSCEKGGGEDEE